MLVDPLSPQDVVFAVIAEMGDGSAERREPEPRRGGQDLKRRAAGLGRQFGGVVGSGVQRRLL
jgi:hypothetical protein